MNHLIVCTVDRTWISDVVYDTDLASVILSSFKMHANGRYECVLSFLPCTTGASSEPTLDDSADRYMCRAQESMSYECAVAKAEQLKNMNKVLSNGLSKNR